ncbi:hypothetical protein RI367_001235 [Sorochytrium milnesiophthora]
MSSDSVHPELADALLTLTAAAPEIRQLVQPLLDGGSLETAVAALPNVDQAKFNVVLAYAINAIFFAYLKVNGADTTGHPVMASIERTKGYFTKIKSLEARQKAGNLRVDQAAASRFVKAALVASGKDDADRTSNDESPRASEQTHRKRKSDSSEAEQPQHSKKPNNKRS